MNNLDKTDYVYNNKKLLGEYSTGNYVDYIYAGDLLVAINKNGTLYYVHNDHLNTPSINEMREFETCLKFSYFVIYQITNANNAVVFDWTATDPFGANQPITNTIDFNIRYPAQYYDYETTYHYNYHRYYNPQTGKYLQADPIGLAGGYNLYNYVDNNSLSGIDPEGLWSVEVSFFFGIGGGVTFGRDDNSGKKFVTYKLGVGIGPAVTYDPKGSRPGSTFENRQQSGDSIGINAGFGLFAGPISAGGETVWGLSRVRENGVWRKVFYKNTDLKGSLVGERGWGIKAGWSCAFEASAFGGK